MAAAMVQVLVMTTVAQMSMVVQIATVTQTLTVVPKAHGDNHRCLEAIGPEGRVGVVLSCVGPTRRYKVVETLLSKMPNPKLYIYFHST